jgi:hypothetical protein
MEGWLDGTICRLPLENVYALDEHALLEEQGYAVTDLPLLQTILIPYGDLADTGVQVGDTIIVAPGTRSFGGAAVLAALCMGAKVVGCGRNQKALDKLVMQ